MIQLLHFISPFTTTFLQKLFCHKSGNAIHLNYHGIALYSECEMDAHEWAIMRNRFLKNKTPDRTLMK